MTEIPAGALGDAVRDYVANPSYQAMNRVQAALDGSSAEVKQNFGTLLEMLCGLKDDKKAEEELNGKLWSLVQSSVNRHTTSQTFHGNVDQVVGHHGTIGEPKAVAQMKAATPLYIVIVIAFFFLALASIGAGAYSLYLKAAQSKTEFALWGATLSTGSVGVALVCVGLLIAMFTVGLVLKNMHKMAGSPGDRR